VHKVVLLAQRFQGDLGTWPLSPLLDRLEARGFLPQLVCVKKGVAAPDDRRVIEAPRLANRWLRSLAVRRLWSDLRALGPELVHALDDATSSVALALCEIGALPYIQSVNRFAALETGLRLSERWCRRIVAASHDLAGDLVKELGVPSGLISVILPGVVDPAPGKAESAVKGVPVVGTTGSSQDVAGFKIFLEAAKLVLESGCEAEFVIVTGEREHDYLWHRARKLGVAERVTLSEPSVVGFRFWSLLDVYCQPSVAPTSGRTFLHGLAHGVPSITTDVKGLRWLIDPGETALLIPPADPRALQNAVIELLESPSTASRLGQHARASIRARFDPDVEADKLAALYREVVQEKADKFK
jgi:glycosyltransferase involved in cell wall biosynthesis